LVFGGGYLAGPAGALHLCLCRGSEIVNGSASHNWLTVEGTVTSAKLVPGDDNSSSVEIVYAYVVDDKLFQGHRLRYDDMFGSTSDLETYPAGREVVIRYHPNHPDRAVLEPGVRTGALVLFAIGLLFVFGLVVTPVVVIRIIVAKPNKKRPRARKNPRASERRP